MAESIDPTLLEQLICDHGAALELYAAQWTTMPEDCVQEAFVKLAGQVPPPDQPVALALPRGAESCDQPAPVARAASPSRIAGGGRATAVVHVLAVVCRRSCRR